MNDLLQDPVVLLAAGGALGILVIFFAFFTRSRSRVGRQVDRLRSRIKGEITGSDLKLKRDATDARLIDRFVKRLTPRPALLRERLQRTGLEISLGTFGLVSLVIAAVAGGGMLMFGFSPVLALPVALLAGLWLPHLAVGFLGRRRAMRFTMLFPEAIGLMVRGIKSGLPITECFQIVGREIRDPVGNEFRQLCDQIRLGQPVEQVLWETAHRVATPEMKFLVVTLSVQRETGGNLAETLENLDSILRRRRQMKLKVRAMSSEARASAAIIGALPFLMIALLSVVDGAYIALLFTRHLGHLMLAGAAASMTFGVLVMAKMVRFNI
jgi:tight adherence protein B